MSSVIFFEINCQTQSNKDRFGLCDDPHPSKRPAYIDENESNDDKKWIAIVNNPRKKTVKFYGVDRCVKILGANGEPEKRCDGLLLYSNNLIFVELTTKQKKWFASCKDQLIATIRAFKQNVNVTDFDEISAYACNNVRPRARKGRAVSIQYFKDQTGFILRDQANIDL